MYCSQCGRKLDPESRFCARCGAAIGQPAAEQPAAEPRRTLLRPREGRVIAGVCAALSNCYGWDLSVVRLLAVLLLFVSGGSAGLAYLALWIFVPEGRYALPQRSTTGIIA